MPKTKKQQSSSSKSDNGPEDQNQPASNKAKEETPAVKSGKSASKGSGGDGPWVFKKLRQVRISQVRGRKMVDIGEHYEKNGKIVRGKKGISLSKQEWKKLLGMAEEITRAIEN